MKLPRSPLLQLLLSGSAICHAADSTSLQGAVTRNDVAHPFGMLNKMINAVTGTEKKAEDATEGSSDGDADTDSAQGDADLMQSYKDALGDVEEDEDSDGTDASDEKVGLHVDEASVKEDSDAEKQDDAEDSTDSEDDDKDDSDGSRIIKSEERSPKRFGYRDFAEGRESAQVRGKSIECGDMTELAATKKKLAQANARNQQLHKKLYETQHLAVKKINALRMQVKELQRGRSSGDGAPTALVQASPLIPATRLHAADEAKEPSLPTQDLMGLFAKVQADALSQSLTVKMKSGIDRSRDLSVMHAAEQSKFLPKHRLLRGLRRRAGR